MRQNAFRLALGAATLLAGFTAAQAAQKTVTTKDATGSSTLAFCAFDAGSFGIAPCHVPVSSSGVELFTANNPGSVTLAFGGSTFALGQKPSAAGIGVTLSAEQESILSQVLARLPAVGSAQGVDTVVKATATPRSLILPVQEAADTIAAGGTTNAVGDVLTLVGGTLTLANSATGVAAGTPAKCTVASVSSGAVTACTPLAGSLGSYTVLPGNPVATTSSGSGSGATLNVAYTGLAIPLAPANAARRGLHVQPQGGTAYLRGSGVAATADQNALQIAPGALYETSPAFVGTGALSMIAGGTTPLGVYAAEF